VLKRGDCHMDEYNLTLLLGSIQIVLGLFITAFNIIFRPKGFLSALPKKYFYISVSIGIGFILIGLLNIRTGLIEIEPTP
jgi:vacuolar-type H+-ATPase subunit I/STV1